MSENKVMSTVAGEAGNGGTEGLTVSPKMKQSPYLDIRGAAAYMGVTVNTVRGWVRHSEENGFPVRRAGKLLRFTREDLDTWIR